MMGEGRGPALAAPEAIVRTAIAPIISQTSFVSLGIDKVAEAERVFHALAEDGSMTMPIQQTFWAARFGMLVDKFGIAWMINCEKGE
jgi:uncharacterized glyoxalase superfamily protein PhnB